MKEYGGYLPFELPIGRKEYFSDIPETDIVRLDCGRSAFWYALNVIKPKKLYTPYLNCMNTTDPAEQLGIPWEYYCLDDELLPKDISPQKDEAVLWTNYYGNATKNQIEKIKELSRKTNVISDNCHAFYAPPVEGIYNCYSVRKFFGVCDGAYLIRNALPKLDLPQSESSSHISFILSSIEKGTNALYPQNLENEERLGKKPMRMSILTQKILSSIDYEQIKQIRKKNFRYLHHCLEDYNEFEVNVESETHMYYPLLILDESLREKIVKRHIYTPTWWRHVPDYFDEEKREVTLSKYMLMLPIDQRYTEKDMEEIAQIVLEEYGRK